MKTLHVLGSANTKEETKVQSLIGRADFTSAGQEFQVLLLLLLLMHHV